MRTPRQSNSGRPTPSPMRLSTAPPTRRVCAILHPRQRPGSVEMPPNGQVNGKFSPTHQCRRRGVAIGGELRRRCTVSRTESGGLAHGDTGADHPPRSSRSTPSDRPLLRRRRCPPSDAPGDSMTRHGAVETTRPPVSWQAPGSTAFGQAIDPSSTRRVPREKGPGVLDRLTTRRRAGRNSFRPGPFGQCQLAAAAIASAISAGLVNIGPCPASTLTTVSTWLANSCCKATENILSWSVIT